MADEILYEIDDGVGVLTINRPEVRNALNKAARDAFTEASASFAEDDDVNVLIVTGAGDKAFCAGADLKEMAGTQMRVPPKDLLVEYNRSTSLVTDKPIIAAVNGHAFAGGFRIAQMVDLVVSSDHATYAISEPKVGRGAPWANPLAWIVGPRIALELLCTAQPLSAERMYNLGFVNKVVPYADLMGEAMKMARAIADNAPLSVRAGKKMVYQSTDLGWEEGLDRADELWEHVYLSEDGLEGPRAFAEKRKPVWRGR
ncbi:MAG: enoyl-CoA hydratase/isomerase family protein [bacterium]|nr:enoyl-CoA hydratase/isomerase family protein [bacterium]